MTLNQPYYIEPRKGEYHLDLNGEWEFGYSDACVEYPGEDIFKYKSQLPKSIYHSLHEAGVLPDPYVGTNSKEYHWVDEKIWYYHKRFSLAKPDFVGNAILCFDGIAYYSKVWINGVLLGDHEGMFGGPVCDVYEHLNLNGDNDIVVEVKACNYGRKDSFHCQNAYGENREIVPWWISRDTVTSHGDFIVIGLWNTIRIEFLNKLHISRPFLYTKSADEKTAELFLEFEIADGTVKELQPFYGYDVETSHYTDAARKGLTGSTRDESVEIRVVITDQATGEEVYQSTDQEKLTDFDGLLMNPDYYELQYFYKNIQIRNPKLWYPFGMGEPHLYHVKLELYFEGRLCDCQEFNTGIRTVITRRTAGNKYRNRWEDFQFSVNGKDLFIKGINWMPIDALYDISPAEYEWCLSLAKNAGIQMLRVWSGGGRPENGVFYEMCDRLGIMVWQDHMLANNKDTRLWPQDILESQEAYNIYRIRNHPSLVLHCGGNEHNPYNKKLAASMFVISRVVHDLDPSRIFHYSTMGGGSAHIYEDMDPAWYRKAYRQLPFVGESGIHSFPSFKTLRRVLSEKEWGCTGADLYEESFPEKYPELYNHFSEYSPNRVPRMLARASQITDLRKTNLEEFCEATHVQAHDFYQRMIQGIRYNYPRCGGILPWVFRRPWATAGIQTVDGMGQPTYPYYAVLQTYQPVNISLCLDWSVSALQEGIPLNAVILNENENDINEGLIQITVYKPDMTVAKQYACTASSCKKEYTLGSFVPDESYTDTCFLIAADFWHDGKLLSRSTYVMKCSSLLADQELHKIHRSKPMETLRFENGPWLKDTIQKAEKAQLSVRMLCQQTRNNYRSFDVRIENVSEMPAYPVTVEVTNGMSRFFANDNFFLMKPGEIRDVRITCDGLQENEKADIVVKAWNAEELHV